MKMNNSQLRPIGSASSLAVTQNKRMKQKDEEADRLAIAAQNGDLTARDELFIRCQPLINWAVKRARQRFPGFDFDDLRQEYYLIFEKCIRHYRSGGGTFKLYLVKAFRNTTPRLYLENRTIPIKNTLLTYQYLKKIGGNVPTFDSISQKANIKFEKERERVETTRPEDVALQHEREEIVADMGNSFMVNFATYPDGIFKGLTKILLFTLIPVGIVNYIPVKILTEFNIYLFLINIIACITLILLAFLIFYRGLKRYSSSNLMSARV